MRPVSARSIEGRICPGSRKVLEESQGKAERTDFPFIRQKWPCAASNLNKKDSHRPDTTVSLTGTSLCTDAIEPTCTERYARWCERLGLCSPSYLIAWMLPNIAILTMKLEFYCKERPCRAGKRRKVKRE